MQGRPCVLRRFRRQQVEDYDEGKEGGIVLELYYNTLESLDEEHFDKSARDVFVIPSRKKTSQCQLTPCIDTTTIRVR